MRPHRIATAIALVIAPLAAAARAADAPLPGLSLPTASPHGGAGGWYLRGDIGYSLPVDERLQVMRTLLGTVENYSNTRLGKQGAIGAGIGYHVTPWLRVDATLEQRFKSRVTGQYSAIGDPTIAREDSRADFEALTGMINAYVDLGTWSGLTPYVGAGVGGSQVSFSNYSGVVTITPAAAFWGTGICPPAAPGQNETCPSTTVLGAKKKTNLAWAVMAGTSVDVSPGLKLDFGYRFMNYGSVAMSPDPFGITIRLKDVRAHEVRFGLRYLFGAGPTFPQVVTAKN